MEEKPLILYVDDEHINIRMFEINCRKKYTVLTCLSGQEGLEVLKNNPHIKAVFSDLKMPGMNGIEFIVNAKKQYPDKPYFLLTGYDLLPEIEDAIETKLIEKYFPKPVKIVEIEQTLNEYL